MIMNEMSVQILVDARNRANRKPLLAELAKRLGLVRTHTEAMREFSIAGLREIIDQKLASIRAGELSIVMEPDGSLWIASPNPKSVDEDWEKRLREALEFECLDK